MWPATRLPAWITKPLQLQARPDRIRIISDERRASVISICVWRRYIRRRNRRSNPSGFGRFAFLAEQCSGSSATDRQRSSGVALFCFEPIRCARIAPSLAGSRLRSNSITSSHYTRAARTTTRICKVFASSVIESRPPLSKAQSHARSSIRLACRSREVITGCRVQAHFAQRMRCTGVA